MTRSDKKYADPTGVLKSIVDDFGNPIEIGDQKDIGEFNSTLLARIQEGLHSNEILAKAHEEMKQAQNNMGSNHKVEGGNNSDVEMLN